MKTPKRPKRAKRPNAAEVPPGSALLTRAEVAVMFHVSPATVARWAREERLVHVTTLGGQRRYPCGEVMRLARAMGFSVSLVRGSRARLK
ncbi:MAG: helix-turn-helix domain-containing protein [Nitrospirota bacterium]